MKSKPFMFAQNVSVPEFKLSKVAVALSTEKSCLLVEKFLGLVTEILIQNTDTKHGKSNVLIDLRIT